MPSSTGRASISLDLMDLDGLRGVAAVWIVLFHSFHYSKINYINLQGSTLMPLFFLLSGFTLTIGYYKRFSDSASTYSVSNNTTTQVKPVDEAKTQLTIKPDNLFMATLKSYYYNRCIRVLPIYYICLAIAIPVNLAGWANVDPANKSYVIGSLITNIIPVNTWFIFQFGAPLDGPSWTVVTLIFYWILFPFVLRHYDKKSDEEILRCIIRHFWFQLFLVTVVFVILLILVGDVAFYAVTFWPPARFPVFIMGVCAGLLCLRHKDNETFPWFANSHWLIPFNLYSCCGESCCKTAVAVAMNDTMFQSTLFYQIIQIVSLTLLWVLIQGITRVDMASNAWFQGCNVFSQLTIIIALVRVKGVTRSSSVLRHPIVLWLGEISMSLYLVHEMIIYYIRWISHHGHHLTAPDSFDCSTDDADDGCDDALSHYQNELLIEPYLIPVILPIGILIATLFYYGIEEPVRIYFK